MIKLYINGILRDDVWIQVGGTLEQTEEHTTESNIEIRVPIVSDNLSVYDYVQIYDDENILFAGNILSLNQKIYDTGYVDFDYRIYELTMSSNADLVTNVLVDMSFPAGSTITQVLKGNHEGDEWYDPKLGEFFGLIENRIIPEGITVGTVENYNATSLESTSYVWGDTCKNLLDNLAELTESFWEITNDKVFNFQRKSSSELNPINISNDSKIFDIDVENDALATYSAVRVVGGEGELSPDIYLYPSQYFTIVDETTLKSTKRIARISIIEVLTDKSEWSIHVRVGYKGIDDDDPTIGALITNGGDTIKLKDGYRLLPMEGRIYDCAFIQTVTARMVSQTAVDKIKQKRGGTGIIEYVLEDKGINNYNDAVLNATRFLNSHNKNTQTFKFSTFQNGFAVGQKLAVQIPYYKLSGMFYISSVEIEFINDIDGLKALYVVECSSSIYRDTYKILFYKPKTLSFEIGEDEGNISGNTYDVEIDIIITLKTEVSDIPTWQEIDSKQWQEIDGMTWNEFYRFTEGVTVTGNYATETIRNVFATFAQGDLFKDSIYSNFEQIGQLAQNLIMVAPVCLEGNGQSEAFSRQNTTPVIGTQFTSSYFVSENEAQYHINEIKTRMYGVGSNRNSMEIPVDIDKSPTNPQGQYAMTIGITVDFQ